MRKLIATQVLICLCCIFSATAKPHEIKAGSTSDVTASDVSDFLITAAEARFAIIQQAKLATRYGSTQAIRDYGKIILQQQTYLLVEIKKLAAQRNITLPKQPVFKVQKQGNDFDQKFMSSIKADHRRDVQRFTDAIQLQDHGVSDFAKKNLPMIQNHLSKAEAL